jgi:hypothetical protein
VVSSRLIRGTRWARLELTTNTARLDRATALADHASGTNIMSGLNLDSPRRMAMNVSDWFSNRDFPNPHQLSAAAELKYWLS